MIYYHILTTFGLKIWGCAPCGGDSSEPDNTDEEGEEEKDVEMEEINEINADADADADDNAVADAQLGGPNRPPPEMTTKINNPPCVRCRRLKITCFQKKAKVGDTKKWPACFACAGKKQRCDWDDKSQPAPGATKPALAPMPMPISSRPTRTTKAKVEPGEPPRKRMKSKVVLTDTGDESSRPAAVIRVTKPAPKAATSKPKATANAAPDADSDADSNIPRFSTIDKGKGRFRGESISRNN